MLICNIVCQLFNGKCPTLVQRRWKVLIFRTSIPVDRNSHVHLFYSVYLVELWCVLGPSVAGVLEFLATYILCTTGHNLVVSPLLRSERRQLCEWGTHQHRMIVSTLTSSEIAIYSFILDWAYYIYLICPFISIDTTPPVLVRCTFNKTIAKECSEHFTVRLPNPCKLDMSSPVSTSGVILHSPFPMLAQGRDAKTILWSQSEC